MTPIIIHSFKPAAGAGGTHGGFSWAHEGTPAEDDLRAEFAARGATHEHRLVRLFVPDTMNPVEVVDWIDGQLLDAIESGFFDDSPGVDLTLAPGVAA